MRRLISSAEIFHSSGEEPHQEVHAEAADHAVAGQDFADLDASSCMRMR
jgi:hypothetical protein